MTNSSARWATVIGKLKTGRGPVFETLFEQLRAAGVRIGGLYQLPQDDGGYDLQDLLTGETTPLARVSTQPDMCEFAFDDAAFAQGAEWVAAQRASTPKVDLYCFPVGRFEARGKGHWPAVSATLDAGAPCLLIMPRNVLAAVALDLPDPASYLELPADTAQAVAFAAQLQAWCRVEAEG